MRAVSMEVMQPTAIEHCNPRGEPFADTLKATLGKVESTTPDKDTPPADQGDFEAAMALLGSLTTAQCAVNPPLDAIGLPTVPAVDEELTIPIAEQLGTVPGDQRIGPTFGEVTPPAPQPPNGPIDENVIPQPMPAPSPPAPPVPAQPSPVGDATVPIAPIPAAVSIVPPALAEALVPPTDLVPTNDEPGVRTDFVARDTSIVPAVDDHRGTTTDARPAPEASDDPADAVRSVPAPLVDTVAHGGRSRRFGASGDAEAAFSETGPDTAAQVASIGQLGTTGGTTNDGVAKVARSLVQLPAVISDLAQQARTESSPRRVVIPLDPPALGHVTVEIIVRADSVRVSLQHGDEAAFNALNAQRPAIEAALEANGLHLSGFDVSGNQQRRASHSRSAARQFEAIVEQAEPDGALRL